MGMIIKSLLILFLCICGIVCSAQSVERYEQQSKILSNKIVSQTYGEKLYSFGQTGTFIRFDSYIQRYNISNDVYRYRYEVIIRNTSKFNGHPVTMYMSGIFVYGNNECLSCSLFPNGMWAIIEPNKEFNIFWFKTNHSAVSFSYVWNDVKFF